MKKRAIIALYALVILIILFAPLINAFSFNDFWNKITGKAVYSTGNECTDTDRADYPNISQENIKGNTYGKEWFWRFNYTDLCITDDILREYYCASTGEASARQYTCSEGCENGACKQSVAMATCTSECAYGSLKCSGDYNYQTCGNYDSDSCYEWSSTAYACPSGTTCNYATGTCTSSSSCTNECTYGSKTCSGNGYKTCGNYDSDSCYEWSSVTNCASGQTCSNGQCASSCNNECSYPSSQCSSGTTGYQTCGNYDDDSCYEWSEFINYCDTGQTCNSATGGCTGGTPSCEDECISGSRTCSGNGYRTCGNYDDDSCLELSSVTNCDSDETCSNGQCASSCNNECSYPSSQCSGTNSYQTCGNYDHDSCYDWSPVTSCSLGQVCNSANGNCECSPQTCTSLGKTCGTWSDGCGNTLSCGTCASGETCSEGSCVPVNTNDYCPSPLFIKADNSTDSDMPTGTETSRFRSHMHDERVYVHGSSYDYLETWYSLPSFFRWIRVVIGRDWKTGCEVKTCVKQGQEDSDDICCYQECQDGGTWLIATEPGDRSNCGISDSNTEKQWFVDEFHNAGVVMDPRCYS